MRLFRLMVIAVMFLCTSAVLAQGCDWTGTWNTGWTGDSNAKNVRMELQQNGDQVTGIYYHDDGRIRDATVNGNILSGTWVQNNGSGGFVFRMEDDCKSFSGSWTSDTEGDPGGDWNGDRV